jgi:hypothetical protein
MTLALFVLLAVQEPQRIVDLIDQLSNVNEEDRWSAVNALVKIGPPALAELEKATQSPTPGVPELAGEAIQRIHLHTTLEKLGLPRDPAPGIAAKLGEVAARVAREELQVKHGFVDVLHERVDEGTFQRADLACLGELLKGPLDVGLRTTIYLDARGMWYEDADPAAKEAGRKLLARLGQTLLEDWPRTLARIAEGPSGYTVFDERRAREWGEQGAAPSKAAVEALAREEVPEAVPVLVDLATDPTAPGPVREGAIAAVGRLRGKGK